MAYRSSVHEATNVSPSYMMLGREITLPIDLIFSEVQHEKQTQLKYDYSFQLAEQIRSVHEYARGNLKQLLQRQRRGDMTKILIDFHEYHVADAVWLHDPIKKKGLSRKLRNHWIGPFLIVNKISDVTYRIQESPRSKPKVVHSDRLKPHKGENKPEWMIGDLVRGEVRDKTVALDGVNIHLGENRININSDHSVSDAVNF